MKPALNAHQRKIVAAVAPLGLAVLAALLVFAFTSGGEPPPATGAAALVPTDALVYIHVSTDTTRPALRRAGALLARLPDRGVGLTGLAQRMVAVVGGSTATRYGRDVRPWVGKEAAFALLDTTGASAGSLIIVGVRDHRRAAAFIARSGAQRAGSYAGHTLYAYATGAELAFVGGYLVVGQSPSVRAAIDVADGKTASLTSNSAYNQAAGDEPAGRVLDAWVSSAGVQRVLDSRKGFFGELGTLLSQPALLGSTISVSAQAKGLSLHVHSALDSSVARSDRTRLAPFSPTLQNVLPEGSTLMLDARNLSAFAPTVMNAIAQIGLLSQLPDLLHRLGGVLAAERFDVRGLLALFKGETAIALVTGSGAPALVVVTRTNDQSAARVKLASLEAPLTQVFAGPSNGVGLTPEVTDIQIGGVTAHQIQLGPGLQLDFAVFRGLIVVATSVRGIADMVQKKGALGDAPAFKSVLANRPDQVTSLGFANFSQLLSLGEQTTLARGAVFRGLQADFQRVRAVGMDSTGGEADTTAELFLQIP